MKFFKVILVISALHLSACAIGPLVGGEAARSNGKGRLEVSGAKGNAGYAFKLSHGFTENFDFGMQWEPLSAGLRGKYAFINNQDGGFSLALAGGAGINWGGSHQYGDLLVSHLSEAKKWEPYFIGRFVHVKNDPVKFREEGDDIDNDADFVIDAEDYNYGQVIAGLRFWPTGEVLIDGELSHAFSLTDKVDIGRNLFIFLHIGYRFR